MPHTENKPKSGRFDYLCEVTIVLRDEFIEELIALLELPLNLQLLLLPLFICLTGIECLDHRHQQPTASLENIRESNESGSPDV